MDEEQLFAALVKAGKMEEAHQVRQSIDNGLALGQRTRRQELGRRGELRARGRELGMSRDDLFVPEESNASKFFADLNYGLLRAGTGLDQVFSRVTGSEDNAAAADERAAAMEASYAESGLQDELTGGRAVAAMLPSLTGSGMARNLLAQAPVKTGAAIGALEMMTEPVIDSPNFWTEKSKQGGLGAGLGAAGAWMPGAAVRGAENVRNLPGAPYRTLMEASKRPAGGPFRGDMAEQVEMQNLKDQSGIDFTPGDLSGSGAIKQAEELARTNLFTRDRVQASDAGRIGQLNTFIKEFRDSLGEAAPIEVVAPKMQAFGREQVGKLKESRRAQANQDYGDLRRIADGQPFMDADNYRSTLMGIVEDGKGTGASPAARSASSEAQSRLKRLDAQGGKLTGTDVDNLTRAEGFVGGDNPFNKTNADTVVQGKIRKSVEADAEHFPDVDEALTTAKSNYKKNSANIDEFEVNLLGQIIGKEFASDLSGLVGGTVSPEKVFKRFTSAGTSATEVRTAFAHLDRADPELANQFRASIVERARQASKVKPAAAGRATGDIDPGTFLRNLGISGGERGLQGLERLAEMFPDDPDFLNAVRRAATVLADKSLMNTSKTETQGAARAAMAAAASIITGSFKGLAHLVGGAGAMQYVTRRMERPGMLTDPMRFNQARRVVGRAQPATTAGTVGAADTYMETN